MKGLQYPSGWTVAIVGENVPGFEPVDADYAAPLIRVDSDQPLSEHFNLFDFLPTAERHRTFARVHPDLVEALEAIRAQVGPLSICSAYRPPTFNRELGEPANSTHIDGLAADIFAEGVDVAELHRVADEVIGSRGGVGLYTSMGFVHVDLRGFEARWSGGERTVKADAPSVPTADLITALECIAAGESPPEALGISVPWVDGDTWSVVEAPCFEWHHLVSGLNATEEANVATDVRLQQRTLEAALRELLDILRRPPLFGNIELSRGFRQVVRRELTRLLGRWYEIAPDILGGSYGC